MHNGLGIYQRHRRRGALLLVVLSVLIMFLMLGTFLVTYATRSRTSATTFASATIGANKEAFLVREMLDEALMRLIRGRKDDGVECLLEDKYQPASGYLNAEAEEITPLGPLIKVALSSTAQYLDLNGRVLTFLPSSSRWSEMNSYRILRAQPEEDQSGNQTGRVTCYLGNIRPHPTAVVPGAPCDVVLNAHEFRTEAHDSFVDDKWLTEFTLTGSDSPTVQIIRPSLAVSGTAVADTNPVVDNDADGVLDGLWSQLGSAGSLSFEVSYLVYDLDSRLNVNAHGSADRIGYSDGDWNRAPAPPDGMDPGFGWGVADVDLQKLFVTDPHAFGRVLGGYSSSINYNDQRGYTGSSASTIRARPVLPNSDGRYGGGLKPTPGATQSGAAPSDYEQAVYGANNSIDLSSMMKVFVTSGTVPMLEYRIPVGYSANLGDDPYEARLDGDAPRLGDYSRYGVAGGASDDNLFTLAEFERVLRPFDSDATSLAQRLAGLLGAEAGPGRLLLTTDSWDTPMLTGTTAAMVSAYFTELAEGLAADEIYESDSPGLLSPDLAAGLRFDINRPFELTTPNDPDSATAESKAAYCRHLYCLLVAIGASPNEKLAQWVANVVDYRDSDTNCTRFIYDTDLSDGWNPTGASVFGHEKIALALAETYAWYTAGQQSDSGFAVMLYRPAEEVSGTYKEVDICAKTNAGEPVWRLRYSDDNGENYVRFDKVTEAQLGNGYSTANTSFQNAVDSVTIPPDGFICVYPGRDESLYTFAEEGLPAPNAFVRLKIDQGNSMGFEGANASKSDFSISLERLADPSSNFDLQTNPYVNVNSFSVKHEQKPATGSDAKSFRRCPFHFWKTPEKFSSFGGRFAPLPRERRRFLAWPDRPFVSQVELAMVPPGPPGTMWDDAVTSDDPFHYLSKAFNDDSTIIEHLLDATYVPSRFLGNAITVPDANQLDAIGMGRIPFRQLSRGREPGRVNLNTMQKTSYANNGVARAVLSGTSAIPLFADGNPFVTSPATRTSRLFGLSGISPGLFFDNAIASDGNHQKEICNGDCDASKAPPLTQENLYPLLGLRTAIRLGNLATIRSNVFAVWVSLKVSDSATGKETFHRVFAIIDRSIPTAFRKGEDLNAKDVIRLKRYLY